MNSIRRSFSLPTAAVVALLFGLLPALPANAAVIPENAVIIFVDSTCSLSDAILSANDNVSVGGCTAGGSVGSDFIVLTQDVEVTEASAPLRGEGLPAITSDITLLGLDHSITRNSGDSFRIFTVDSGTLQIQDTTISGGSTTEVNQPGGGFYVEGGANLYMVRCTVSGNSADSGGGIFSSGRVDIRNSLVTQNTAVQSGAGLETDSSAVIYNSTFSGNTLTAAAASTGIAVNNFDDNFNVNIALSTFSGNSSNSASSSTLKGVAGSVRVEASIIANTGGGGVACEETLAGGQWNKDDDGTCEGGGDLTGLDPVLADNGGPTQTHALLAGSNAIDHAGDYGELQDQRGFPRDPNLCDSGAFEYSLLFEDGFESGDTSAWSATVP